MDRKSKGYAILDPRSPILDVERSEIPIVRHERIGTGCSIPSLQFERTNSPPPGGVARRAEGVRARDEANPETRNKKQGIMVPATQ